MAQSTNLPHIYYTVSELSLVKDLQMLKNVNIKTIGYIQENFVYDVDFEKLRFEKGMTSVRLNLNHLIHHVSGIKPYIIFGKLYSLNNLPVISAKTVKQFDGEINDLQIYHNQLLELRKRSFYFVDLKQQ